MPVGPAAEVDLGDRVEPERGAVSTRAASSTAYPVGTLQRGEQRAAHRPLAGQRLHQPGQLGEEQAISGRATSSVTRPPSNAAAVGRRRRQRPLVEALHQRDLRVG